MFDGRENTGELDEANFVNIGVFAFQDDITEGRVILLELRFHESLWKVVGYKVVKEEGAENWGGDGEKRDEKRPPAVGKFEQFQRR